MPRRHPRSTGQDEQLLLAGCFDDHGIVGARWVSEGFVARGRLNGPLTSATRRGMPLPWVLATSFA